METFLVQARAGRAGRIDFNFKRFMQLLLKSCETIVRLNDDNNRKKMAF